MNKVAIHGAPRSGTTWLANIFNSNERVAYRQQPLFSYTFKDFLDENSSHEKIERFFSEIYHSDDNYLNQLQEIQEGKVHQFEKNKPSHIVYKEVIYHYILSNLLANCSVKLVGIIRNPIATLTSFYKAPAEFKDDWNFDEEWLLATKKNRCCKENYFGYSRWKEVAKLFHTLQDKYGRDRVILIRYSDLLKDTTSMTEYLFQKLDLEISNQTIDFIRNSKSHNNRNAYSVFKNRSIDDELKYSISEKIVS